MANFWKYQILLVIIPLGLVAEGATLRGIGKESMRIVIRDTRKAQSRKAKRSKLTKKKKSKKKDQPLWPLLSLGIIPFLIVPYPSISNFTKVDPDCACDTSKTRKMFNNDVFSKSSTDMIESENNYEDDENIEMNFSLLNTFHPMNPEDFNERYCRCHCYCDDLELLAVFRNETNGKWANDNEIDGPDLVNSIEPNCGCIDPTPYVSTSRPDNSNNYQPSSGPIVKLNSFPNTLIENNFISVPPIENSKSNLLSPTSSP